MSDVSPGSNQDSSTKTIPNAGTGVSERASELLGKTNEIIGKIDWSQMGKYGKAAGIVAIVIVAQVIIKVVIDTVNFFPLLPGLLELLGVIVVGQWSWENLTTSDKRNAVLEKVQNLRKEYLG